MGNFLDPKRKQAVVIQSVQLRTLNRRVRIRVSLLTSPDLVRVKSVVGEMSSKFPVKSMSLELPWQNDRLIICPWIKNCETSCLPISFRDDSRVVNNSPLSSSSCMFNLSYTIPKEELKAWKGINILWVLIKRNN